MKKVYSIFSKLMRPAAKKKFIGLTILCILGAFVETLGISLVFPYISALANPDALLEKEWMQILCRIIPLNKENLVLSLSLILLMVYVVKNVFLYVFGIVKRKYILDECFATTKKVYAAYLGKPYRYFLNHHSNDITNIINVYVTKAYVLLQVYMNFFSEIVVTFLLVLLMFWLDATVTLMVLVVYGGMLVILRKFVGKRVTAIGKISNENYDRIVKSVSQSICGIQDVKILQRQEHLIKEFDKYRYGNVQAELKMTALSSFQNHLLEVLSIAIILVCVILFMNTGSEDMLFATFSSLAMILLRIRPGLSRLYNYMNQINYYMPALEKLDESILDEEIYYESKEEKEIPFKDKIKVENVSFSYDERKTVLENINLEIKKGSVIGIKGVSGGGKTTLANILLGLIEPDKGTVSVDGFDIHEEPESWFSMISYIPQAIFLLDGTILENITFYRELDEAKAWEALEKAHLKEFVEELPDGIHTLIGERGVRLSGGQRQRLGIARAVYNDAQIFIFDEPTAALNAKLEKEVMDAIYSLEERTIILIAHRLNTLEHCDKIYEVADKKIVEVSGHDMD